MALQSTTLRPGLLVSLKTSLNGNVSYIKQTIEAETITGDGKQRATWETTRVIDDPEEHERAEKIRSKANSLIRGVCAVSAFGLLCPEADSEKLSMAIDEARQLVRGFNATAKLSRVAVHVITGRIAPDDVEAVKAINSEIRDLMTDMTTGLQNMDADAIRAAASRAKAVATMLPADIAARAQLAIDTARKAARTIKKAGETAALQIDNAAIRRITEARTAFLDLDDSGAVIEEQAPVAPAVDFDTEPQAMAASGGYVPQLDLI
jgi:hypothetical protein